MTAGPTTNVSADFDVAVIGYGPTGVTAANILGAMGVLQVLDRGDEPRSGAIVDVDRILVTWMREKGATAVAPRPDRFVYAVTNDGVLAEPPVRKEQTT